MGANRQIVDPPRFTPTPYGLLSTVQTPAQQDEHWMNGITYQPFCSGAGSTYDECIAVTGAGGVTGPAPASPTFTVNDVNAAPRGATAFSVMVEFDCSTVGNNQAAEIARVAMQSNETHEVERAFWTGQTSRPQQTVVFPHLAANQTIVEGTISGQTVQNAILLQTAATIVTGGGDTLTSAVEALGLLEGSLADCYNGVGVIHVPQLAVPSLDAYGLIHARGSQMYTMNGNLVAVGAGYPGSGPSGPRTADKFWMYATGAIMGYRSDIKVRAATGAQAVDKAKNTIKMIAERRFLLAWDCCHFAAQASLGAPKGT